jgi:hypothetical protein
MCFDGVMENISVAVTHIRDKRVEGFQFPVDSFESSLGPGGTVDAVYLAVACIPERAETLPK